MDNVVQLKRQTKRLLKWQPRRQTKRHTDISRLDNSRKEEDMSKPYKKYSRHFQDISKTFQDISRCFTYYTNIFRIFKTTKKLQDFKNFSIILKYFQNLTQLCTNFVLVYLQTQILPFQEHICGVHKHSRNLHNLKPNA